LGEESCDVASQRKLSYRLGITESDLAMPEDEIDIRLWNEQDNHSVDASHWQGPRGNSLCWPKGSLEGQRPPFCVFTTFDAWSLWSEKAPVRTLRIFETHKSPTPKIPWHRGQLVLLLSLVNHLVAFGRLRFLCSRRICKWSFPDHLL
jgi:hypothetical protein